MKPKFGYNILHVTNVFFGIPYFFGNQLKYFENKGYNIHVIVSPSEYMEAYANEQGIKYKEIPITRAITPWTDLCSIVKTIKYARQNKIDTIVGHTTKGSLVACVSGRLAGIKNIVYFRHGIPYDRNTGIKKKILVLLEKFISRLSTKIVCVSPSLANLSIKEGWNEASKQCVLGFGTCGGIDALNKYNPDLIDESVSNQLRKKYNITENDFIIGYCGRIEEDKGIFELIDAFNLLQKRHPGKSFKLLLVGTYDPRLPIPQHIREEIEKNHNIIKTGYIRDGLPNYYSLMDICVLPSYHEGFGMCMVEAQGMGIPVLTTKSCGCIDSIIENTTGFYVDIEPNSICNGIEKFFDEQLRQEMGKNARRMVLDRFDHSVVWPYIEKLY